MGSWQMLAYHLPDKQPRLCGLTNFLRRISDSMQSKQVEFFPAFPEAKQNYPNVVKATFNPF